MIVLKDLEFNPLELHPHSAYRHIYNASKRIKGMQVLWLDESLTWDQLTEVYLPCVGYANDLNMKVEAVIAHQLYQDLIKSVKGEYDLSAFKAFRFNKIRIHYATSLDKTRAILDDPLYYLRHIDYLKALRYTGYVFLVLALLNLLSVELNAQRYQTSLQSIQALSEPVSVVQNSTASLSQVHDVLVSRHEALVADNPHAKGWIRVSNTPIDFPLVQTDNNDYYLFHDHLRQPSAYGSIYLDYRVQSFEDTHVVIYGHAVKHQAMFGHLIRYTDVQYLRDHPIIEITSASHAYRYQIFSVHLVDARVTHLALPIPSVALQSRYQDYLAASMHPPTALNPFMNQILTLVSCEYSYQDGRIFVHAVLIEKIQLTPNRIR